MQDGHARSFSKVLRDELDEIQQSRTARGIQQRVEKEGDPFLAAAHSGLVGLAFSGGGIRSATFNLGVLQGLAHLGLMSRFDYLSTVSGGGYIGSWLAGWTHRLDQQEVPVRGSLEVALRLRSERAGQPEGQEPGEINFLRQYSNYLTPRRGLLGADTWTMIGIYLRNFFLNLTILVLALMAMLLLPRLQVLYFSKVATWSANVWPWVPWILLVLAFIVVVSNLSELFGGGGRAGTSKRVGGTPWIVVLLLLSAWFLSAWLCAWRDFVVQHSVLTAFSFGVAYFAVWLLGWFLGELSKPESTPAAPAPTPPPAAAQREAIARSKRWTRALRAIQQGWATSVQAGSQTYQVCRGVVARAPAADLGIVALTALFSGMAAGALFVGLAYGLTIWSEGRPESLPLLLGIWGFPAVMGVYFVAETLHIGLSGRGFHEDAREWWGRLGGIVLLWTLLLSGLFVLVIEGPWLFEWLREQPAVKEWLDPALILGWLATTVGGILAGRSPATGASGSKSRLELVGRVAPLVFVLGLLLLLSVVAHRALPPLMDAVHAKLPSATSRVHFFLGNLEGKHRPESTPQTGASVEGALPWLFAGPSDRHATYWAEAAKTFDGCLWLCFLVFLGAATVLSLRVGINDFSMHAFYRNRLVRCYLGAARVRQRNPHPFTGFDPDDDQIRVSELRPSQGYSGPYPIVNVALNLVQGAPLAWQQRKATSFVFTPRYSGYEVVQPLGMVSEVTAGATRRASVLSPCGYRPTHLYAGSVSLGTAVAISGAAASPNMGYHSSPSLAFLMTVFNVRLGWWIGNPRCQSRYLIGWRAGKPHYEEPWERREPWWGLSYLLCELIGKTNDRRGYVYLSDGGHFENLGIYELVRRRCLFIVACDASADPDMDFGDLAGAVEKCRADFGVEIDINVRLIRQRTGSHRSRRHCAIGRIRYDRVHPGCPEGVLVYLKPSLLGDEPADVLAYQVKYSEFPHQTTADQWFDETQFESYRALGEHIAGVVFGAAGNAPTLATMDTPSVFREVASHWA